MSQRRFFSTLCVVAFVLASPLPNFLSAFLVSTRGTVMHAHVPRARCPPRTVCHNAMELKSLIPVTAAKKTARCAPHHA